MGHVTRNVAGIYENPKTVEQAGPVYTLETKEKQQRAVAFLDQQLFNTPKWLLNKPILGEAGYNPVSIASYLQEQSLNRLLSVTLLNKLIKAQALADAKAYTPVDLLAGLDQTIWQELHSHTAIDVYKRNLQKVYISDLEKLTVQPKQDPAHPELIVPDPTNSDVSSIARAELNKLRIEIKNALPLTKDALSRGHLVDMQERISRVLKGNNEQA
jgi:hypothetical protein